MTIEHKIAEAFRAVALRLQHEIDTGRRDTSIDANDLFEALTSVADQLAPPGAGNPPPTLLDAARALLEARENQMVTRVEWDNLRDAVSVAEK